MKLNKVVRWEFRKAVMNKGFVIMTVLLPALIGLVILVYGLVEGGSSSGGSPNPPPFLIAVFLALLLFIGAFISGVMVFYGVLKEKGSRVVELMLSSVSAKDLMAGKIIGLGLAGLIQVTVWAVIAYFAARRFLPITLSGLSPMQLISYPPVFCLWVSPYCHALRYSSINDEGCALRRGARDGWSYRLSADGVSQDAHRASRSSMGASCGVLPSVCPVRDDDSDSGD